MTLEEDEQFLTKYEIPIGTVKSEIYFCGSVSMLFNPKKTNS
jgi:hypothetical protein